MEPQSFISIICLSAVEYETSNPNCDINEESPQILQLTSANCGPETSLQLTFEDNLLSFNEEALNNSVTISLPKSGDVLEAAIREIGDDGNLDLNNVQEAEAAEALGEQGEEEDQALTWDERSAAVKALLALSKPEILPVTQNSDPNVEAVNSNSNALKCPVCSKVFKRKYDLKIHLNIHFKLRRCICEICGKEFHHKSNLIRHMRGHNGTKPYKCSLCSKRFTQSTALHNHRESAHNETTNGSLLACFCGKSFKSSGLLRSHKRKAHPDAVNIPASQSARKSFCPVCGLSFKTRLDLRNHERDHAQQGTLSCTSCLQSFSLFSEWRQHKCERVKPKNVTSSLLLPETNLISSADSCSDLRIEMPLLGDINCNNETDSALLNIGISSERLTELRATEAAGEAKANDALSDNAAFDFEALCQVLGVWNGEKDVSKDRIDLEDHISSSNSIIGNENDVNHDNFLENREMSVQQNENLKNEPEFPCPKCKKVFKRQDALNNHLGVHDKSLRQYKCNLCEESFAFQRGLSTHLRQEHNQSLSFDCSHCEKTYNSRSLLNDHMRRDHFKERSFACDTCEKVFFKKSDLTVHARTHQKERPYCCSRCGKRFGHISHVLRHELIHAGERPHKCDFPGCDKAFNQSNSLKKHKATHAPKVKGNKLPS